MNKKKFDSLSEKEQKKWINKARIFWKTRDMKKMLKSIGKTADDDFLFGAAKQLYERYG